jgi:hypothetical protein
MPVIGRLDKQVEDVIISPVSKRRRDETNAPRERDSDSPATKEQTSIPPTQTPTEVESSKKREELPVWLL